MKTVGPVAFENVHITKCAKYTEWPQTKLKESGIKSTLPMCAVVPRVPNVCPFRSTMSCFQDIAHFRIFTCSPMIKFQSAIIFVLILADRQYIP